MADVPVGLYNHFKGGVYTVLGTALLVTGEEPKTLVLYRNEQSEMFARTLADFTEPVRWPDGTTAPRFVQIRLVTSIGAP